MCVEGNCFSSPMFYTTVSFDLKRFIHKLKMLEPYPHTFG